MKTLDFARGVHDKAVERGHWERPNAYIVACAHAELSAAFDVYRNDGKPSEIVAKLIDACMIILDMLYDASDTGKWMPSDELESIGDDGWGRLTVPDLICYAHRNVDTGSRTNARNVVNIICAWIRTQGLDPSALMIERFETY